MATSSVETIQNKEDPGPASEIDKGAASETETPAEAGPTKTKTDPNSTSTDYEVESSFSTSSSPQNADDKSKRSPMAEPYSEPPATENGKGNGTENGNQLRLRRSSGTSTPSNPPPDQEEEEEEEEEDLEEWSQFTPFRNAVDGKDNGAGYGNGSQLRTRRSPGRTTPFHYPPAVQEEEEEEEEEQRGDGRRRASIASETRVKQMREPDIAPNSGEGLLIPVQARQQRAGIPFGVRVLVSIGMRHPESRIIVEIPPEPGSRADGNPVDVRIVCDGTGRFSSGREPSYGRNQVGNTRPTSGPQRPRPSWPKVIMLAICAMLLFAAMVGIVMTWYTSPRHLLFNSLTTLYFVSACLLLLNFIN